MKKIFSIILVCCATFAFANEDHPIFQETDEDARVGTYRTFAAEEPTFEEDDDLEACNECDGCDEHDQTPACDAKTLLNYPLMNRSVRGKNGNAIHRHGSYVSWKRFKTNFGMEKLFICFPQKPAVSQSNTLLTAYAYDHAILYSLTGYFPPCGNICSGGWFNDVLSTLDQYPFSLISKVIFQASNGDWLMDYTTHDYVQNLIIKGRAIVTPFNAYTLQCVKPNGSRDHFDYFIDNYSIKCDCK